MTTSGSINFSVSRDDIIEEALMHLGALGEGGAPTSDQLTDHSRTLNIMVKAWQARGINIWAVERLTVFLEEDKSAYTLGTDHVAKTSTVARTTLASAAASGASTVSVSSATGISDTYAIGVELDDGTMQWTTVNGAPAGTTITLTATLTGAAAAGNNVYVYAAKSNALYFKYIVEVVRRTSSLSDTPVQIVSRQEYHNTNSKSQDGSVTQIYFQPTLTANVINVWPESNSELDTLELIVYRTLEDFDAAGDTPDFPQEWYEALCLGLASRLANVYGKSIAERKDLREQAKEALEEVEGLDKEQEVSTYIQPVSK